jgi:putative MATE family efflux protein
MAARESPEFLPPLVREPVARTLVSLALPSMWGVLMLMVSGALDTLFAKQLGLAEQAALSFTAPIGFVVTAVSLGLSIGAASLIARTLGQGDRALVGRMAGQSIVFTAAVMLVIGVALLVPIGPLFAALGATPDIIPPIREYMLVYLLGSPIFALPMVSNSVLRAVGQAREPSIVLTLIAGLKVAFTPLLMLGGAGWEGLGIAGAALATVIAFGGGFLLSAAYLKRADFLTFQNIRYGSRATVKGMMVIGLPSSLTNMLGPVCILIAIKMMTATGLSAAVVAGYGIAARIESIALVPLMALSGVIGPFVGQNLGAKRPDRMAESIRLTLWFCLAYGLVIAGVMALLADWIAHVSTADANPEAIAAAKHYFWIVPASFAAYGVLMLGSGAFNGVGEPKGNLLFYGIKTAIFIPGVMVGAMVGDFVGVCIAIACANGVGGLVAWTWLRRRFLEDPAPHAPALTR